MRQRLTPWLLLVFFLVAVPFWWLLIDTDRGNLPPKPVHIVDLRRLANSIAGPHPAALTYTVLATRLSWGDFVAAGIGLQRKRLALVTWVLPVPGRGPVLIDPVAASTEGGPGTLANFDRVRQGQLARQGKAAGLILFTQTPQALQHAADHALAASHLPDVAALAVAPGVVVIPASGYAPGAWLIYVQLADRREFLFTGAIAALTQNWTKLRARSRLAAAWGPPQDRAETYAWLRTIRQLRTEASSLIVVPGQDATWLSSQRSAGTIADFKPGR